VINFRFHLISLIAVFLALAVGVVMGYAVLGQPTVDTLQSRVNSVEARANEIRAENDDLRAEQARLESVLRDIDEFAATNRLAGASVLPVAARGVDAGQVTETVQLARRAGGIAPGIVWLEEKWGIEKEEDATELAAIVGASGTSRAAIREAAARALATRLATGPTTGRPDLLTQLDDAGFVSFEAVDGIEFDPAKFDGRTTRVLAIAGNQAKVSLDRSALPLARALVAAGRLVVVADDWRDVDGGPDRGVELGVIREDRELSTQVSTVDNFDTPDGPVTSVLVLADRGQGAIGHYGFGKGADRAVPAWWVG